MQNPLKGNSLFASLGAPHDNITFLLDLYIAFMFHLRSLMRATCSKLKVAINKFQKAFSFYSSMFHFSNLFIYCFYFHIGNLIWLDVWTRYSLQ